MDLPAKAGACAMSDKRNSITDPGESMVYQIRVKGHLGGQWTDWFEGLTITLEVNGDTLLTGPVVDQAALFGLLRKVRDVGIPLLSVNCLESSPSTLPKVVGTGPSDASNVKQ
jgi:hypothetical protein